MQQIHRISLAIQNILAQSGGDLDSDNINSCARKIQYILNSTDKAILDNVAMEECVLYYMIHHPQSYNDENYTISIFTNTFCKKVYQALEELIINSKLINYSVVKQMFPEIVLFIKNYEKEIDFDIVKALAYLNELDTLRKIKESCLSVMQFIDNGGNETDTLSAVDDKFISCELKTETEEFSEDDFTKYLEQLENKRPLTYFPQLDRYLRNALNTYIVIGARPNQGKTALAMNILLNNMKNYTEDVGLVYFFSLEMTKAQIYSRLISTDLKIDFRLMVIHRHKFMGKDATQSFAEVFLKYKDRMILDDSSVVTVKTIIKKIRIAQSKGKKISLIMIDYLQIMQTEKDFKDDNQKFTEISQGLKAIVKEFCFPVILLCQLNREVERRLIKTPLTSDIKGCGAVEENADFIIMLDCPQERDSTIDANRIDLVIVKNKFGEKGTVEMKFKKNVMLFEELNTLREKDDGFD